MSFKFELKNNGVNNWGCPNPTRLYEFWLTCDGV